jgi:hypothetical protein
MANPVQDPSKLPGTTISDQVGNKIGKVCDVYTQDDEPMWVTVESSTGLAQSRLVFIPIARLKEEDGQIRVPYSAQRINESPEVEAVDELSREDDMTLRYFYGVDRGDDDLRTNEDSYASRVPDSGAPVRKSRG